MLRHRPFRLLWAGQVISNFGDALTSMALLITAQRLSGSIAAVAATAIAIALPQLLFGLLAGVMVDRWNRRRVMIVSDLLRAVLVLGFLAVTTRDRLWLLYVIAFAQSAVGTFFNPARGAFLPEAVPADRLLQANSLSEMSRLVAGVAGTAAAGAIAGLTGSLRIAFITDAATFLASAVLIARISDTPVAEPPPRERVWAGLAGGLRVVFGSRRLLGVVVAATVVMFGLGAVNVLLVPFVVEVLGLSETWFGALEAAQVASMVLAGGALAVLAARFRPTTLISVGLTGVGMVVAAMAASTRAWHLMGLVFAVGWFVTPVQASVSTILQTEVPARLRGRALASFSTMVTGASLASMAVAGTTADAVGIRAVLLASGLIAVIAGLSSAGVFRWAPPRPAADAPGPDGRVPFLVDWRIELVAIPVSDVDRAKAFYTEKVGFNADQDHRVGDELRFVQLTPPGSACSIALGTGITTAKPGSVQGMQMVVSDIHAARAELVERGVDVSEVQEFDWGSFVFFNDPDGNGWAVQQLPPRD